VFGGCQKIWLLFPPTKNNLKLYIPEVGIPHKLKKIGADLEGGLIVQTDDEESLEFPSGTLHAVFTVAGGLIGGINYSEIESLPVMADMLAGHLEEFREENTVLEDLDQYVKALRYALKLDKDKLLPWVLRSWVRVLPEIRRTMEESPSKKVQVIKAKLKELKPAFVQFAKGRHDCKKCACGKEVQDIGKHLQQYHALPF